jgi:hypothetical protein
MASRWPLCACISPARSPCGGASPLPVAGVKLSAQTPLRSRSTQLAAISLWLSPSETRSSLHYDPFHNVLVVLSGTKSVTCGSVVS